MSDNSLVTSVPNISDSRPILVIPVGSFEQHGPHLPLDTDTQIALSIAHTATESLCREGIHLVLGPTIAVSASDEHRGFPGTLSIGTEGCAALFVAVARSATWARGVIFVNGHGGNADAIRIAAQELHDEDVLHAFWSVSGFPDNDSHAGCAETSLMLHIAPHTVQTEKFEVGNTQPLADIMPAMRHDGVAGVSPNGVLGDPREATAQYGAELFARNVKSLIMLVTQCHSQWA